MPWRMTASPSCVHLNIQHGQEMRRQLAVSAFDRKVFLVVAHYRDKHLFRQRQVLGFEVAQHHGRPFGQMNDGFNQRLVFAPSSAGDSARGRVERLANGLPAFGYIDDDIGFAQFFSVTLRKIKPHGVGAVQNAMAAAGVTRLDAGNLQWDNGRIEQRNDPADGPHIALRLARAPVHIFGPVEGENFFG